MTDPTDPGPYRRDDDRPGPDVDVAGIESRTDEDAGTVTFLSNREDRDTTTAWLTVDAEHVVEVADRR